MRLSSTEMAANLALGVFPEAFASLDSLAFASPWTADAFALTGLALSLWDGAHCICFVYGRQVLDEFEVDRVATHPDHRRRGLARQLLEHLRARAPEWGLAKIFLEVAARNAPALGLYEKLGFQRQGLRRAYYRDGDDAVMMSWCP